MTSRDRPAAASFSAPDHEYPSHLELVLSATDSSGLENTTSIRLNPRTVALTFTSSPPGLQVAVGSTAQVTPFTRTVIQGSGNSVSAVTPQVVSGTTYTFANWSDDGAQNHVLQAPLTPATYTATFASAARVPRANLRLGTTRIVSCMYVLPRQNLYYGRIAKYEVYTSTDGTNWGTPAAAGTWLDGTAEQDACLTPRPARYVRLRALSAIGSSAWTTAAEINIAGV